MKISKNAKKISIKRQTKGAAPVKASEDLVTVPEVAPTESNLVDEIPQCDYCTAIEHITKAIGELSLTAGDDPIALDAIANLSVVLLDLKG